MQLSLNKHTAKKKIIKIKSSLGLVLVLVLELRMDKQTHKYINMHIWPWLGLIGK